MNQQALSSFLWSVADLLRGDYKQADYGKIILPFTVLRRLDCVLGPTKDAVLQELATRQAQGMNPEPFLLRKAGQSFYNTAGLDLKRLMGDQDNIAANLYTYVQAFSPAVRDIFERFEFSTQVDRLCKADQLIYVNSVIKGKLMESETLVQQASHNSKEQFSNSPTLTQAILDAIIDAFEAHSVMSKEALDSARVREGLKDVLLGPSQLYESLRSKSGSGSDRGRSA